MKLWPRSMAGQLVAVLLLGLLTAHVLAIVVLRFNAEILNPVARDRVVERLAITSRMVQLADARDVPEVLETMSSPSARFWIDAAPPPQGPRSEEEQRVLVAMAAKLPHVAPDGLRAALQPPPGGWLGAYDVELGWSFLTLETAVRLADGRWLHARQQPLAGYQWWRLLRFSLPTSTLPVLVIVLIFVYRTLRPIKALAEAAERVSRGERIDPLPVTGPSEAREVSAAFNLMQSKLTRFIDDRTRLLAAISHDFRTPITALRLRAELLDDPQQRAAMTRTLDEMRVMVEQTLSFAHDDSSVESTADVDLQALLHEVVAEHQALGHDASLAPGPGVMYRARSMSLRRAVGNLVDNAVRHGGFARVRLVREAPGDGATEASASVGSAVRIEVDDGGPGLDPAMVERAFEPFFQLDAARNHQGGGVGLGLSIARSCVRAHGGDVHLSNLAGGGLRATIALP